MNTKIYKQVHTYAIELLKAADSDDEVRFMAIYTELKALCEDHEADAVKNHPVQWEALADFTDETEEALPIYQKALDYAKVIHAHDYIASIAYSMAMLLNESGQVDNARQLALTAKESVGNVTDNELKREIIALLKLLNKDQAADA